MEGNSDTSNLSIVDEANEDEDLAQLIAEGNTSSSTNVKEDINDPDSGSDEDTISVIKKTDKNGNQWYITPNGDVYNTITSELVGKWNDEKNMVDVGKADA